MKMRKIIIAAMAIVLALSVSVSASAGVLRASSYLSSYAAWLTPAGSGNVTIAFDVSATGLADSVGVTKIIVQKKQGTTWVDAKTYNSSTTSGMLASNCLFHCGTLNYGGVSGTQYRAVVTVYSKIGTGSDSKTITTSTITA
jgi:hypothetical protein